MGIKKAVWPILHAGKQFCLVEKHKSGLRKIVKQAKGDHKKLYYFGMPEHANLGDQGQYYCLKNWMKEHYSDYQLVECYSSIVLDPKSGFKEFLDRKIRPDDLLVIHSGYNTNDLSTVSNKLNLYLMSNYQNNKLIVMPQTVFFQHEENKKKSAKVFNARKNMVFMARDAVSYDISKEMMPDGHVLFVPDIVTTLIGSREENKNRSGIILCHRHDGEQFYHDEDFTSIGNQLADCDSYTLMDTTVNKSFKEILKDIYGAMMEVVQQFENSRIVITDRYHGMIYSLVANTPVIVMKTTDHKVVEGYHILKQVYPDRIWFAESPEEAVKLCREILKNPCYEKLDCHFKRDVYAKLPEVIEKELNGNADL